MRSLMKSDREDPKTDGERGGKPQVLFIKERGSNLEMAPCAYIK
jgi:hypothetical protein